jgi:CBS domain containing-hemolysin-like protein
MKTQDQELLNKITNLQEELYIFFGTMSFNELEYQFGYSLHGLENDAVELMLGTLRDEWDKLPLDEKHQIIEQLTKKRN